MSTDELVQLVALAACLVLAVRGLRSERLALGKTVQMALAWVLIIAALTYTVKLFAP